MVDIVLYQKHVQYQLDGTAVVDYDTDTLKCALLTSGYTPAQAHDYFNDVSANEVSGTNYTAGGNTCSSVTANLATGTGTVTIDMSNLTWSQASGGFSDARYAVWYKVGASGSSSPLIARSADFGAQKGNTNGDLTLDMSSGLLVWNAT